MYIGLRAFRVQGLGFGFQGGPARGLQLRSPTPFKPECCFLRLLVAFCGYPAGQDGGVPREPNTP